MKNLISFVGVLFIAAFVTGCGGRPLPLQPDYSSILTPTPYVPTPTPGPGTPTVVPTATATTHTYYVTIQGSGAGTVDAYVGKWAGAPPVFVRTTYSMSGPSFMWTSTSVIVNPATETFHLEGKCVTQNVYIIVYKDGVILAQWNATLNLDFAIND